MPGIPPINKTPYLDVGAGGVLQSLIGLVGNKPLIPNAAVPATLGGFVSVLQASRAGDLTSLRCVSR